jgi:hypothetical protein
MLIAVQDGLWVCRVPYRAMGFEVGRQLVAVSLPGGGLWIHSPIPVTSELRADLARLGGVAHVVAPSVYHDECLAEFQAAYPHARFHGTPGIAPAVPAVRFGDELSDTPHPDWAGTLGQHLIRGMPKVNEVVFLHPASRSLIIADIALNLGPDGSWLLGLVMRLNGAWGKFRPTRFARSNMRDKAAVRASLDTILGWDFDRVIVGHGRNIETGGRAAFREAFAFLP